MRYYEIIETDAGRSAKSARDIWKQTQNSHEALRRLRSKQEDVEDSKEAAKSLPAGAERTRRLQTADRKSGEARRVYGAAQNASHDKIIQTLAKN